MTSSSDSSGLYTSTILPGPPLLMQHSRPTLTYKLLTPFCPLCLFFLCSLTTVSCSWLSFYAICFLSSSDSLRVLQRNASGLRARSTELLHFLSSHHVDLICIQKSNLNSFSSFRIPGFSTLRSDCIHSRSGILSPNATHASGGGVIFVRLDVFFPELSNSYLSTLDPYFDYVGATFL